MNCTSLTTPAEPTRTAHNPTLPPTLALALSLPPQPGSVVYDRCSQLDKALMVFLLMGASVACWATLFLAELPPLPPYLPPPPPAAAAAAAAGTSSTLWSLLGGGLPSAASTSTSTSTSTSSMTGLLLTRLRRLTASAPPLPRLQLAARTKTVRLARVRGG